MSGDLLAITFRGIDEGADPKSQPVGTLLRALNCGMDKARRLKKRDGTISYAKTRTDSGSLAAGKRLVGFQNGDLSLYDGQDVFNRVTQSGSWHPTSRIGPFTSYSRPMIDGERSIICSDYIVYGNVMLIAWQYGPTGSMAGASISRIYLQAFNIDTGQAIADAVVANNSVQTKPRLILGATNAFLLFRLSTEIKVIRINLTTFALGATTLLATGSDASADTADYDACIGTSSAGEVIYLVYGLAAGASRVQVRSFLTATLAADKSLNVAAAGTTYYSFCICFCPLANLVGITIGRSDGAQTYAIMLTIDLAVSTALTSLDAVRSTSVFIAEYDATRCVVGWQRQVSAAGAPYQTPTLVTGLSTNSTLAVPNASKRTTEGMFRPSKPWKVNSRWYVGALGWVTEDQSVAKSFPQASYLVLELLFVFGVSASQFAHTPQVGTLENLTGHYDSGLMQKPMADANGDVWVPTVYKHREPIDNNEVVPIGWNIHRLTTGDRGLLMSARLGPGVFLAGLAPLWSDGDSVMPYGISRAPLIIEAVATAGGAMGVGTYTYVAVFTWIDRNGIKFRSLPSPPVSCTTAGGNLSVVLKVGGIAISDKQDNGQAQGSLDQTNQVNVELYRTTVNGTVHHLLPESITFNQSNFQAMTDVLADADVSSSGTVPLATQPILYTETGELGDIPPPAAIAVITNRGRLAMIDSTKRTLWFSKDSTEDSRIAPGFNEALVLAFAHDKTSLATLDDKLIVFGDDSIDVVFGAGPDATGAGEWQVQNVQTDVGCINPRSPVTFPGGVLFQSARGIESISRELTITWVGKVIEETLAQFPVITSATLVAKEHEVRFTCNAEDGATGIVLAWDYLHAIWFTRKYTDLADTSDASVPFVDADLIDDVYTMLTAGGQVYVETTDHNLENGTTYVERDILLAPISPAGPMGWCRVKDFSVLGTGVSDHDMTITLARDYAVSAEQTKTFAATTPPVTVGPLTKCRITYKNQQCRATQIRIQDVAPSTGTLGIGAGAIYEGLALRVTIKPGTSKTKPSEQG